MQKWQRNYEAIFDVGHYEDGSVVFDEKVTISLPLTLNLNISIGALGSANEGQFQFYNLSPDTRKTLWLDNFNIAEKAIAVTLRAGYGSDMPIIFVGWVQNSISYKDGGSTEWVTTMQAFEGGSVYDYGYINSTYTKGTSWGDIYNDILKYDERTKLGYISKDIAVLSSDKTLIGQPMDLIKREFEGYEIFINRGELNILSDKEVIPAQLPVLTDSSGMLGSPKRSGMFLEIDMLFEPQILLGQAISLKSKLLPDLNQEYKVMQINHSGTISAVTSGSLTSSLTLVLVVEPEVLKKAEPTKYTGTQNTTNWAKPVQGRITSYFGKRTAPLKGASTNHQGIDIGAAAGMPVSAPADGRVITSQWLGGYGRCVQIDHGTIEGKNVTSLYGHLSRFNVQPGQRVYKGQTIGLVGNSGNSTGPHLHFEVRENNRAVNPLKYIGNY